MQETTDSHQDVEKMEVTVTPEQLKEVIISKGPGNIMFPNALTKKKKKDIKTM